MSIVNGSILITGANGFIGSRLTKKFAQAGYSVVAIDLAAEPCPFVSEIQGQYPIRYLTASISNLYELAPLFYENQIKGIIHSTWDWSKDPLKSASNNILGLINVIEMGLVNHINTFIYIGSDVVYSGSQDKILEGSPFEVKVESRLYPVLKVLSTLLVRLADENPVCRFLTAVPGGPVYGVGMLPGRESRWPIYYMLEYALRGEKLILEQGRDSSAGYTHIDDLCEGVKLLYETPSPSQRLYHFGPGHQWNMEEVAEITKSLLPGARIEVGPGLAKPGDCPGVPNRGPLDIQLAKRDLGFWPKYQLEDGMRELLEWMSATIR